MFPCLVFFPQEIPSSSFWVFLGRRFDYFSNTEINAQKKYLHTAIYQKQAEGEREKLMVYMDEEKVRCSNLHTMFMTQQQMCVGVSERQKESMVSMRE